MSLTRMLKSSTLIVLISLSLTQVTHAASPNKGCTSAKPKDFNCLPNGDIDYVNTQKTYDQLSRVYADFAWNDFLALNFPAKEVAPGQYLPEPSDQYGLNHNQGSYRTVWQTYIEDQDLFQPQLPAFGTPSQIPAICQQTHGNATPRVASAYMQANRMGPVADIDKNYVRFNIVFNRKMYDYVKARRLNTAAGQEAITQSLEWPSGRYADQPELDDAGAIMIKASWKILTAKDNKADFHHIKSYVYTKKNYPIPGVEESCALETLGLIGLHIVHRSNSAPQWVWATFEHRDNAPWMSDINRADGRPEDKRYHLFDSALCQGEIGSADCPFNRIPDHPWDPGTEPLKTDTSPSQIVRTAAPGKAALAANQATRKALKRGLGKTVWENYFLVNVQFPTLTIPHGNDPHEINPAYPIGLPSTTFLINSSMESFIQGFTAGDSTTNGNQIPDSDLMLTTGDKGDKVDPWNARGPHTRSGGANRNTSSCVGCHADASMVNGIDSGFVFSVEGVLKHPNKQQRSKYSSQDSKSNK